MSNDYVIRSIYETVKTCRLLERIGESLPRSALMYTVGDSSHLESDHFQKIDCELTELFLVPSADDGIWFIAHKAAKARASC